MSRISEQSENKWATCTQIFSMNKLHLEQIGVCKQNFEQTHLNKLIAVKLKNNCELLMNGKLVDVEAAFIFESNDMLSDASDLEGIHPNVGMRLQNDEMETVQECSDFCAELCDSMNKRKDIMSHYLMGLPCFASGLSNYICTCFEQAVKMKYSTNSMNRYVEFMFSRLEKLQNECKSLCDKLAVSYPYYHEKIQQICETSEVENYRIRLQSCCKNQVSEIFKKLQTIFYQFLAQVDILRSDEIQNTHKAILRINNELTLVMEKIQKLSAEQNLVDSVQLSLEHLHLNDGVNKVAMENDELISKLEALIFDRYD